MPSEKTSRIVQESVGPLLAAIVAASVVAYATASGIGATPDSTTYVTAARTLLAGEGLRLHTGAPMTVYPAGYPVMLAVAALLTGGDPALGGRALHIALSGVIALAIALVARLNGAQTRLTAAASAVAFTCSVDFVLHASMLLSEVPAISLLLAGLGVVGSRAATPRRDVMMAAGGGLLLGLAASTRYACAPFVAAVPLAVAALDPAPLRHRMLRAGAALAGGALPVVAWMIRNRLLGVSETVNEFAFHPPTGKALAAGADIAATWFLPLEVPTVVRALLVSVAAVVAIAFAIRKSRPLPFAENHALRWLVLCALAITAYLAFLLTTMTFVYAHTPIDARLLLPVWAIAACAMGSLLELAIPARAGAPIRIAAVAIALLATVHVVKVAPTLSRMHRVGLGFGAAAWRNSPTMLAVKALPTGTRVYSNAPDAIRFVLGRSADPLPRRVDPGTNQANPDVAREVTALGAALVPTDRIVYFDLMTWRSYLVPEGELKSTLRLQIDQRLKDGRVLRPPSAP